MRRNKHGRHHAEDDAGESQWFDPEAEGEDEDGFDSASGAPEGGPFDASEMPDDRRPRLDLGSIRIPVPDGAQVQVEMVPEAAGVRAVHLLTPLGQVTINAYAAPRSGGLWEEVRGELAEQLHTDGAKVGSAPGEWGEELTGVINDVALRFIGVDGPRWMLRGVIAGPRGVAGQSERLLRDIVRGTVVVRGTDPMPVRTPLPLVLPPEIANQIEQVQAQQR